MIVTHRLAFGGEPTVAPSIGRLEDASAYTVTVYMNGDDDGGFNPDGPVGQRGGI